MPIADTVLFNGGVFRAEVLAERLQTTLGDWRGAPLRVLHNDNPDVAVARGAVAYALVREGHGQRIGGGSARSYFLVIDQGNAQRGLCLLPRGTEEGHEIRLPERTFSLRLGQPVRFHLASSVADSRLPAGRDHRPRSTTSSSGCRRSRPSCAAPARRPAARGARCS
jgi:hypothetical protein